jgi:chromosome segregation ATPase
MEWKTMMDIFGYAKASELESIKNAVKSELANLKSEIVSLRHDLSLKVTDSEEVAKAAATGAVEAEGRVKALESNFQSQLEELQKISLLAKTEVEKITIECEKTKETNDELIESIENTTKTFDNMLSAQAEVDSAKENIHSNIESINEAMRKSETLPEVVSKVDEVLEDAQEVFTKIDGLLSHSATKKNEIDELRDKILGKDIEVDGVNTHIDGIKDKLEKSYIDIDSQINGLKHQTVSLVESIKSDHDAQFSRHTEDFKELVSKSKNGLTK